MPWSRQHWVGVRASNEGHPKVPEDFTITEKALLELSHLKHQAKQDMLINLPVPYDLGVCVLISRLQWVNACLAVP